MNNSTQDDSVVRSEGHEYLQKKVDCSVYSESTTTKIKNVLLYGTSRAVHQEHNDKERGKMSYTATTSCTEKLFKCGLFIVDEVAKQ